MTSVFRVPPLFRSKILFRYTKPFEGVPMTYGIIRQPSLLGR